MRLIAILTLLMMAVAVHEYGHYRTMVRSGVEVRQFAVGFGPVLWQTRMASGTMFQLRALPLGGFVEPKAEGPNSMASVTPRTAFKISMAGMFANALTAFGILLITYLVSGGVPDFMAERLGAWRFPKWTWHVVSAVTLSFGVWLATPFIVLWMLVRAGPIKFLKDMAGPIGILAGRDDEPDKPDGDEPKNAPKPSLAVGLFHIAAYLAMLNAAIAGFNLLPLMPLDGGLAFQCTVLGLFGNGAAGFLHWYSSISQALFWLLIAAVFVSDIAKLAKRNRK